MPRKKPEPKKEPPQLRIVSDGNGSTTKIHYGDAALTCVTQVDLHLAVGEPNRATLEVLNVAGEVQAEIVEIRERLIGAPKPQRHPRVIVGHAVWRWFGRRSWWRLEMWTPVGADHFDVEVLDEGWGPATAACEYRVDDWTLA